ncbi:MAG: hypothetical protein WCC90_13915 [Methylocella sp.]
MKIMLTDRTLRAMKPAAPGTRKMLWDAAVPSFGAIFFSAPLATPALPR